MKNPDPSLEDEAFEELALKQGHWQYTSGWRKKQIVETGMTQDEVDIMWQQAMRQSVEAGEVYVRYHFAKLVAERALADPMREVQRLGQEIEQERNFCPRCGKRTKDMTHIHTCTPPQD